jgi:Lon protease-like protein
MVNHRLPMPGFSGRDEQVTWKKTMEMPLFPLKNVVLFPGMVLPLHIFELRYREMINRCIDEHLPFGVVLIAQGQEVGVTPQPCMVGTAARVMRVERENDGRMNITTVGTQRFRVLDLDRSRSYLSATVAQFPVVNGAKASGTNLRLDRLPEDPLTLAFLVAIALQVKAEDKQRLLEQAGIPEILALESRLIARESMLMQFMVDTQRDVLAMNSGPTGYIFPN